MKNMILFFFSILVGTTGFADSFVLNNKAHYPASSEKSKIAIQWASSAKDVEESNKMVRQGLKLKPETIHVLTQRGKINLDIPKKAEYFRVLVWSKGAKNPDFLTNWVDIVPNKIYTFNEDHLIPSVLMSGTGC